MSEIKDELLKGNERIEKDIVDFKDNQTDEMLAALLTSFRKRMQEGGHMVVAVDPSPLDNYQVRTMTIKNQKWMVAFTSFDQELKGKDAVMSTFTAPISQIFDMALASEELAGVLVDPWDLLIALDKNLISIIKG